MLQDEYCWVPGYKIYSGTRGAVASTRLRDAAPQNPNWACTVPAWQSKIQAVDSESRWPVQCDTKTVACSQQSAESIPISVLKSQALYEMCAPSASVSNLCKAF